MAGAGKDNINVIKQELPKFIREFKERTNQPEAPNINSKRLPSKDADEDDDELQKADEAPIICVDKGVTEEEAYTFTKEVYGEEVVNKNDLNTKRKHDKDDEDVESGKVFFKKPTKEKEEKKEKKSSKKIKSEMPKVKNKTLLSFGDEDEEEDI